MGNLTMAKNAPKPPMVPMKMRGRPKMEPPSTPVSLIRKMIAAERLDPRWGTWLGMEYLKGLYSREQWDASLRFAALAERRQRALQSPGVHPKAQDLSAAGGRSLREETDKEVRRHLTALSDWHRLTTFLPKEQMKALDTVVVRMMMPDDLPQQVALRKALTWLVEDARSPKRKR